MPKHQNMPFKRPIDVCARIWSYPLCGAFLTNQLLTLFLLGTPNRNRRAFTWPGQTNITSKECSDNFQIIIIFTWQWRFPVLMTNGSRSHTNICAEF